MKVFILSAVMAASIFCLPLSGETNSKTAPAGASAIFTGGKNSDWFEPANWASNAIPSPADSVAIRANCRVAGTYHTVTVASLSVGPNTSFAVEDRGVVRTLGPVMCEMNGAIHFSNGGAIAAPRSTLWIWLVVGFAGQALFTGRMLVQWIASERAGASVVPRLFWFLSLTGGLIVLIYAIYQKDAVIIAGQAFGSFVYIRNLILGSPQKA